MTVAVTKFKRGSATIILARTVLFFIPRCSFQSVTFFQQFSVEPRQLGPYYSWFLAKFQNGLKATTTRIIIVIIIPIVKFTDISLSKTFLFKFKTLNAVKRKFPK